MVFQAHQCRQIYFSIIAEPAGDPNGGEERKWQSNIDLKQSRCMVVNSALRLSSFDTSFNFYYQRCAYNRSNYSMPYTEQIRERGGRDGNAYRDKPMFRTGP